MGGLVTYLLERQVGACAKFADTFSRFLADETRQHSQNLFRKTCPGGIQHHRARAPRVLRFLDALSVPKDASPPDAGD